MTLTAGSIVFMGLETGFLGVFAAPFLYLGCLLGWMIKGDNFASDQEFLRFGFAMSVPINAVIGVLLGVMVGLIKSRVARLKAIRAG